MASRKTIPTNTVSFIGDTNGTVTRHYALTYANVYKLAQFLRHTELNADYMYNDQSEYIVSLKSYPLNVLLWFYDDLATAYSTQGQGTDIAIGPFSTGDVDVKGYYFGYIGSAGTYNSPRQKNIVKICTISISEDFSNFMDYSVTKLYLFIPFVGWQTLDNSKYMGKEFTIYASIDFQSGDILYSLCYGNAGPNGSIGDLIETFTAHVGIDISLNRTNANDIMRNTYYNVWKMLGDTAGNAITAGMGNQAKGITGAIGTGVGGTTSIMRGLEKHMYKGGVSSGRNSLITPTSVLLVKDKANPVAVTSAWESLNGYPLQETRTLSALSGYTEVGEIHFNPSGADIYNDEINEIVTLLQSGVIL